MQHRIAVAIAILSTGAMARASELRLISGPTEPIRCLAYSPSGKSLVFGGDEKLLRIADDMTHAVRKVIATTDTALALAWSPKGDHIVALFDHSGIASWTADGLPEWTAKLPGHASGVALAFSHDGKSLVVGASDGTLQWIDPATGMVSRSVSASKTSILSVALSKDGAFMATADGARTRIWDLHTGKALRDAKSKAAASPVTLITFSPDSRTVAGGTAGGQVRFWGVLDGEEIAHIDAHTGPVRSVAYSVAGDSVLTSSADRTVRLWDLSNGNKKMEAYQPHEVLAAVLRSDALEVASGGADGVYVWDAETALAKTLFQGLQTPISALAYVAGAGTLAVMTENGFLAGLDPAIGQTRWIRRAHSAPARAVVATPDGRYIVTAGGLENPSEVNGLANADSPERTASRGDLKVWTGNEGVEVRDLGAHGSVMSALALSADGRTMITATDSGGKGDMIIWDLAESAMKMRVGGTLGPITSLAFAKESPVFASGSSDGTALVIDSRNAVQWSSVQIGAPVEAVALSPDAGLLITASQGESGKSKLQSWDAHSGKLVKTFGEEPGRVRALAYSPDGWYVLSASEGNVAQHRAGEAKLWIAGSWQVAASVTGPDETGFTAAVFAPDIHAIALAGTDRSIRMWSAK